MVVVTGGRVGAQLVGLIFGLLEGFFDDFWRGFLFLLCSSRDSMAFVVGV